MQQQTGDKPQTKKTQPMNLRKFQVRIMQPTQSKKTQSLPSQQQLLQLHHSTAPAPQENQQSPPVQQQKKQQIRPSPLLMLQEQQQQQQQQQPPKPQDQSQNQQQQSQLPFQVQKTQQPQQQQRTFSSAQNNMFMTSRQPTKPPTPLHQSFNYPPPSLQQHSLQQPPPSLQQHSLQQPPPSLQQHTLQQPPPSLQQHPLQQPPPSLQQHPLQQPPSPLQEKGSPKMSLSSSFSSGEKKKDEQKSSVPEPFLERSNPRVPLGLTPETKKDDQKSSVPEPFLERSNPRVPLGLTSETKKDEQKSSVPEPFLERSNPRVPLGLTSETKKDEQKSSVPEPFLERSNPRVPLGLTSETKKDEQKSSVPEPFLERSNPRVPLGLTSSNEKKKDEQKSSVPEPFLERSNPRVPLGLTPETKKDEQKSSVPEPFLERSNPRVPLGLTSETKKDEQKTSVPEPFLERSNPRVPLGLTSSPKEKKDEQKIPVPEPFLERGEPSVSLSPSPGGLKVQTPEPFVEKDESSVQRPPSPLQERGEMQILPPIATQEKGEPKAQQTPPPFQPPKSSLSQQPQQSWKPPSLSKQQQQQTWKPPPLSFQQQQPFTLPPLPLQEQKEPTTLQAATKHDSQPNLFQTQPQGFSKSVDMGTRIVIPGPAPELMSTAPASLSEAGSFPKSAFSAKNPASSSTSSLPRAFDIPSPPKAGSGKEFAFTIPPPPVSAAPIPSQKQLSDIQSPGGLKSAFAIPPPPAPTSASPIPPPATIPPPPSLQQAPAQKLPSSPLSPQIIKQQQVMDIPPPPMPPPPPAAAQDGKAQSGSSDSKRKIIPSTGSHPVIRSKIQSRRPVNAPASPSVQKLVPHPSSTSLSSKRTIKLSMCAMNLDPTAYDAKLAALERQAIEQKELINKLQSENSRLRETNEALRKSKAASEGNTTFKDSLNSIINSLPLRCKNFESGRQMLVEKPNIRVVSKTSEYLRIEVKVFFSRQFDSPPKVEAWIIGNDNLFKVPPKSVTMARSFFMVKISLNTETIKNPHMHWTAYTEQDTNDAFTNVMQSIMSLSKSGHDDYTEMIKKFESGNLLYLTESSGQNLVHAAAQAGNAKLVNLLIEKGVDYDIKDIHGWTPLTTAINAGALEVANLLISRNASLTNTTIRNGNLLHYLMKSPQATENKEHFYSILNILLSSGIDINAADDYEETALTYLCNKGGSVNTLQKLISHGADVNKPGKRGLTPLQICVILENTPFAGYLLSNGADPELAFRGNKNAKLLAMETNNTDLQNLFLGDGDLSSLPEEVMYKIFTYLHPKELVSLRLCSKKYRDAIDKVLNDHEYMDRYGNIYEDYIVHTAALYAMNETLRAANHNMDEWLQPLKNKETANFMTLDTENSTVAEYKIQISVVGPTGYGKTTFISTIRDGIYPVREVLDRTHCISLNRISHGSDINIILWDSWCRQFDTMPNPDTKQISSSDGIILAYDSTDPDVLQNISVWKRKISTLSRPDAKVLLVETKSDLDKAPKHITLRQVAAIVKLWKTEEPGKTFGFIPVSSKKMSNLEAALKWISDGVVSDLKYALKQY